MASYYLHLHIKKHEIAVRRAHRRRIIIVKKRLCAELLALTMILSTSVVALAGPSGTPKPPPYVPPGHLSISIVTFDGGGGPGGELPFSPLH